MPPPWEPAAKPARSHGGLEAFGSHTPHSLDGGIAYKPLTRGWVPFTRSGWVLFTLSKRYATINKSNVIEPEEREGIADPLTELLREGAQQLIQQAVGAELEELLAFYSFPVPHWQSIRTTNPIESTFATIRHRTRRSRGCLTRDGMLHMMFKLGQCAEKRWRRLRGFHDLSKVITGVKFNDGSEVSNVDQTAA